MNEAKFKVGDKVRALRSALDILEGNVYEVSEKSCSEYVCIRDEVGEENALLTESEYELVNEAAAFKVGDVVTPRANEHVSAFTRGKGYVVTGCDEYSVYIEDDDGEARMRPVECWSLVRPATETSAKPAPYYLVSSAVEQFRTQHASEQDAKDWVTVFGVPGTQYTIHEARAVGTFNVVRELREAV